MLPVALRRSLLQPRQLVHSLAKGSAATPPPADTPAPVDASKRPRRGGQNLSERYNRLERSLRQKAVQSAHIEDLPGPAMPPDAGELPRVKPGKPAVEMFRGFIVPEEPIEPGPDECCMSGCAICVNDLYADSLKAYNDAVGELRKSLQAAHVPQDEWPARVRAQTSSSESNPTKPNASLSAFEAMELALAAKRAKTDAEVIVDLKSSTTERPAKVASLLSKVRDIHEGLRWVFFGNR